MKPPARVLAQSGLGLAGLCALLIATLSPTRATSQTVILSPPPITAPVHTLSVSDIDFLNSTTPKWLFTIAMVVDPPGSVVTATMTIRLRISLAGGEEYPDAVIIRTKDPHFTISGSRVITNLDLNKTIPVEKAEIRSDAKRRLEEIALPSGAVPAGTYEFVAEVTPAGGTTVISTPFSIVLTNPSSVELLTPVDGDALVNQYPTFQWIYDGQQSRLSLYQKLPHQSTLEEAASGVPHLSTVVASASFQYPSAGVRPLEPGNTYVWFVEGLVPTSGGTTVAQKSALRSFTVASPAQALVQSSLLDELELLLGPAYRTLFDQIRAEGLSPSGVISLNGSPISLTDLRTQIARLRANPEAITSAGLE